MIILACPALFGPGVIVSLVDPPAIVHHQLEVLFVVDACGDEVVVVYELKFGDDSIPFAPDVAVLLESEHEVFENILLGFFPTDKIGMLSDRVDID